MDFTKEPADVHSGTYAWLHRIIGTLGDPSAHLYQRSLAVQEVERLLRASIDAGVVEVVRSGGEWRLRRRREIQRGAA